MFGAVVFCLAVAKVLGHFLFCRFGDEDPDVLLIHEMLRAVVDVLLLVNAVMSVLFRLIVMAGCYDLEAFQKCL